MKKKRIYAFFIGVSLAIGIAAALLTSGNMDIYNSIKTPPLSPPSILFPIVWSALYILMGISAARVFIAKNNGNTALAVWSAQLAVNFFWSIIFFNFQAFLFAFIWLLILWLLIIIMIFLFKKSDKIAAYLQLPYLLWVTFAGYLNFAIYLLNR